MRNRVIEKLDCDFEIIIVGMKTHLTVMIKGTTTSKGFLLSFEECQQKSMS